MNKGKTIFSQIMSLIPERDFQQSNHGKTKSVRNQKRNAIFRRKNEMCNKKASKQ